MSLYTKKTAVEVPVATAFAWHARNGAIQRLTPPWAPMTLLWRKGHGIDKGVRVCFRLRPLGIPLIWEAEHTGHVTDRMFRDRQVKGPFSRWEHTHLFHPDGPDRCIMEDHIEYDLPMGRAARPFYSLAGKELSRMFDYRHRILKSDLEQHADRIPRMRILISGASGTIGAALVPFLRTCGHEVIRLVRYRKDTAPDAVFWDPARGILDVSAAGQVDAVINLNGQDISRGQWTRQRRQQILDSRIQPTRLLVETLAAMPRPPAVFLSASAIGIYGEAENRFLTEGSRHGDFFISHVCREWEAASLLAESAGSRTVQLRIGVVLSPAGGALARMLLPFRMGLGARLSHGRQYMSWISMDDTLAAIHHILGNSAIRGPVNLTAPCPVTNRDYTKTLARVLSRPAPFVIPARAASWLWQDMGRETLMSSARVMPEKLISHGFSFQYPTLEPALRHTLGR